MAYIRNQRVREEKIALPRSRVIHRLQLVRLHIEKKGGPTCAVVGAYLIENTEGPTCAFVGAGLADGDGVDAGTDDAGVEASADGGRRHGLAESYRVEGAWRLGALVGNRLLIQTSQMSARCSESSSIFYCLLYFTLILIFAFFLALFRVSPNQI
jgi:hypothetical protein